MTKNNDFFPHPLRLIEAYRDLMLYHDNNLNMSFEYEISYCFSSFIVIHLGK